MSIITTSPKLNHQKTMKFLDKAAIVTEDDNLQPRQASKLWKLNTVHTVKDLKSVFGVGPLWTAGIFLPQHRTCKAHFPSNKPSSWTSISQSLFRFLQVRCESSPPRPAFTTSLSDGNC